MSFFTMEDSLESGWVSVRPNLFEESERHKFVFIVAWNDIEGKFAITCHDRTIQKRTTFRDSLFDYYSTTSPLPVTCVAEKHSAIPSNRKGCSEVKVDSNSRRPTKRKDGGNTSFTLGLPRAPETVTKTPGSWDVVSPKVMEIEVLETEDFPGELATDNCDIEGKDGAEAPEEYSWAGLYSFHDLRAAHSQLCAVNSDLEPCLPAFPEEQSGMWTVIFGAPEVSQRETDALCYQVQVYLGHALDTCGWKILSQVLFSESDDTEEYYENLSELRQKGYEDALERAKTRLQELLERHRAMDSMVELLQVYPEEDQAYGELLEESTQLYQYLLQPFRDMRELAMLRRQQIKITLTTERLGPRRVEALTRENEEWQRKAHAAVLSIQNLTTRFFETTARAQKAMYDRMRADQKKFGRAAWAVAAGRMEQLQYSVSKETLQLMRAKEICLEQRKRGLKEEMQSLQAGHGAMLRLDQLEALYYQLQLQLYDVQAEVLRCEELLLTAQLGSLRRQMTERQEEVVYYDAYESPDAMQGVEEGGGGGPPPPSPLTEEQLAVLQSKTRQLEARRGRITSKRAYLKNKKEICIINHNQKMQQSQGCQVAGDSVEALHQRAEEEEEEKRRARVGQDRQSTLLGLRSHSQRFHSHVTLKSSRLHLGLPPARRRPGATQVASVQTDPGPEPGLGHSPAHAGRRHQKTASLPPAGSPLRTSLQAPFSSMPPPSCCSASSTALSTAASPPPPPPLPPPPPPPPSLEDLRDEEEKGPGELFPGCDSTPSGYDSAAPLALAPFSPRFFDSSQLLNARKKLRKTASLDSSSGWRRAGSPMDEVLASLKRGCFRLRKAELRVLPDPDQDDSQNILAQIRQGVLLRKVCGRPADQNQNRRRPGRGFPSSSSAADALTRSIHEALRRIKEASPDSESEDEGLPCADWEN